MCLPVCLSVCLSFCMSACLSVCLPVCSLSMSLFLCVSLSLSLSLSFCLCLSLSLSHSLSLSLFLFTYIMGLHGFFARCNSARIFFVMLNSLQIVLWLLWLCCPVCLFLYLSLSLCLPVSLSPCLSLSLSLFLFTYIMGLHGFFARCNSARIFFVILNSLQIVLGLLRLQILEESNDSNLIVLNEFGYLENPISYLVLV